MAVWWNERIDRWRSESLPTFDNKRFPAASLEQYGTYLRLLKEYCKKAVE